MSLENDFEGLSLGDDLVIIDHETRPQLENNSTRPKRKNNKRSNKKKNNNNCNSNSNGNSNGNTKGNSNSNVSKTEHVKVKSNIMVHPLFAFITINDELMENIIGRIERAVLKLRKKNEVEIELKFGRMFGKHSEVRLWSEEMRPSILHKLSFGHFDSGIGLHYYRRIIKQVGTHGNTRYKEENSKNDYFVAGNKLMVHKQDLSNSRESWHKKRIIHDFYIHNPTSKFDFKVVISEKVEKSREEVLEILMPSRHVFSRKKSSKTWLDLDTKNISIANKVKISDPVRNHLYEFEMQFNALPLVMAVRDKQQQEPDENYAYDLFNFIKVADLINEEVS